MKPFKLLNVRIDQLTRDEIKAQFEAYLNTDQLNHIATVNPEFLVKAHQDESFQDILNQKTCLNICDGSGISLWSRILYKTSIPRIPGVSIAELLCEVAAESGQKVYFIGGFNVAESAAKAMQQKFPGLQVALTEDGNPKQLNKKIIQEKPAIALVAFGSPAQENWIQDYGSQIPSLRIAGGFGGTFDFWAGRVPRAPKWMQTVGLEWFYRLLKEPKKRGGRIYTAVITFSVLVLKEKFTKKQ